MALLVQPGRKLLFVGDSITDAGRAQPAGEGLFGALGTGYVNQVDSLLQAVHPERRIRVVNQGTSGNTVVDLRDRWDRDVAGHSPQWLSVMIGINDVWRQFDAPLRPESHVLPKDYQAVYSELLARTRPGLEGLVLMTPFVIESNRSDAMRARMDEYGQIVFDLAKQHDAILVDTQAAFDAALAHHHATFYAWDRIHPTPVGTMVIARAFLNAIGFAWS